MCGIQSISPSIHPSISFMPLSPMGWSREWKWGSASTKQTKVNKKQTVCPHCLWPNPSQFKPGWKPLLSVRVKQILIARGRKVDRNNDLILILSKCSEKQWRTAFRGQGRVLLQGVKNYSRGNCNEALLCSPPTRRVAIENRITSKCLTQRTQLRKFLS